GFYAAWTNGSGVALAVHLGPANTGAAGWPNGARAISNPDDPNLTAYWPQIALAPDGGIFMAWASATIDDASSPSAWLLRRLDSAGLNATGWPKEGLSFGSFHREYLLAYLGNPAAKGSLLALSADGRGGVFLVIGDPIGNDQHSAQVTTRI